MYDRAETAAAHDRLWALFQTGFGDGQEALTRDRPEEAIWEDPNLLVSQTCGLPFRLGLHRHVSLVGTPVYDLPCPAGMYFSVLVARRDDPRTAFSEFDGSHLATNSFASQSGWAAPALLAHHSGMRFGTITETGSHLASAQAVAASAADIAAIDVISWRLMCRFDTFTTALSVVAETPPSLALPMITARPDRLEQIRAALTQAIRLLPEKDRDTLMLRGLRNTTPDAYLAEAHPPNQSAVSTAR